MGISIENVATEVRKIIKGSGYRLEMFTEQGEQTLDDRTARRFFLKPSNIMVTLDETEAILKLHKPDIVQLEQIDQLHQTLKNLARKYKLNFDFKSFGHSLQPKDYVHQAIKSMNDEDIAMKNMAEGMSPMSGSTKSSYQLVDDNVKLIVRHTKPVDEAVRGSRSRNIKALFIENGAGERFQYPHIHLAGARAMARHVSMGGTPYDSVGTHISTLSEDYKKLQRFIRYATSNNVVNEETTDIIEAVRDRYWGIRKELGRLKGVKGYAEHVNAIHEDKYDADDDKITEIRNLFTAKTFDESLEEVLPLISQILEYRLSKDAKKSVGDKLSGDEGLNLVRSKVENVQFNEPGEDAAEYSSSNIINFAKSPQGKRDEVAYKISEMAQLVDDALLTEFLAQISEQFRNDEFPGQDKVDIVMELLEKATEQGVFSNKDSADVDTSDDEFAQQDKEDMPDKFDPPEVENRQFENWIKSIADDDALFEEIEISEDDFVDFNRALAFAKERMNKLPRMSDGAPLIRRVKGMCEEVATEYDVKAEDLYAVLSGEDVINEGEPTVEGDYKGFGSGPGFGNPAHAPDAKRFGYIKDAVEMINSEDFSKKFYGNFDDAYKAIVYEYGQEVADSEEVQNALMASPAMEDINRIRHLAGVEPVIEDDPDYSDEDRVESLDEYGENSYESTHAMEVIDIIKDKYGPEGFQSEEDYPLFRDAAIKEFLDENNIKYDDEEFEVSSTIDNFRTDVDTYQPEESSESVNRIKHLAGV
jgi:hypothetical protein